MVDTGFVRVADVSEIPPGGMKAVKVGAQEVLLVNVDGIIHACDNWCNHQHYRLSAGGIVDGEEVSCDLHGSKFNVVTGDPTNPPAIQPLKVFEVRLDGSDILVRP